MSEMKELFDSCLKQEQTFVFDSFSRENALQLGLMLNENAKKYPIAVAIEITVNNLSVFRFFPSGCTEDNSRWLNRKQNTVHLMEMSSLRAMATLALNNETSADRKLDDTQYAFGGGGFPITIKDTGVIGSICVSGLPHMDDHQLIVDTLTEYFK